MNFNNYTLYPRGPTLRKYYRL